MEEPTAADATPKTAAEYRAEIDALLAQMQQMNETSDRTREEIERLKADSEAIRADSDVIAAQTDRRLESIFNLLLESEPS
jgi:methyl-accepting chemotaxis protein